MKRSKPQQNIYDLVENLNDLKDFLRDNDLPLDTSYIPSGILMKGEPTNKANALNEIPLEECPNNCWLCRGVWDANGFWYADCIWQTV